MPERPYKGLMPYDEADAPFFFGREAEQEIISANLMASRLTLLYGPSGVGKSSVLRAGVVRHLRVLVEQNLMERGTPEFAVVVFNAWRDDPITALAAEVKKGVSSFLSGQKTNEAGKEESSLVDTLRFWSKQIDGDLLIILDQFEEYFLYHSREGGEGTFAVEFPRAVNREDLHASFLISVREDALAKLDRFKGRIPSLFDNYLRIDHLDRAAARDAIEKPIAEYNRLRKTGEKASIQPELVEAILDQVKTGQVVLGAAGRGVVAGADESRVETPYLQLVMTRLWDEEIHASQPLFLRLSTLKRLGGAERIVRTHLDTTMSALPPDEQDAAARIFRYLVTPSGTKIAHAAADLAEYAQVSPVLLEPILEKLSGTGVRILRPVAAPLNQPGLPRYEIFHDVLAGAIVDWRTRYVQAQHLAEAHEKLAEERQRANKLRWGMIGLTLVLLLMVGLAVFALHQRATAKRAQLETEAQRQVAVARELSAAALNNLEVNPERSLLLSLYAVSATTSHGQPVLREAEEALHRAVQASRLQLTLGVAGAPGMASCVSVAFSPDGRRVATGARGVFGSGKVWDAATGKEVLALFGHAGRFSQVVFSRDGRRLATAGADNTAKVWDAVTGKELLTLSGHSDCVKGVVFSPDGRRLTTAGDDKTAKVWDAVTGKELLTLSGHNGPISRVAFSPDGRRLATACDDKTAKVWDAVTGKELLTLSGHDGRVSSLAFSPDGRRLATADDDGTAKVWDAQSGQQFMTLYSTGESNNAIAFDATGTRLVTGYGDGVARVWDATTGRMLVTLSGDAGPVWDIAFSPDGTRVATANDDGIARVWDVSPAGGPEWFTLVPQGGPVLDITYSPDGKRLATACGFDVKVWDASNGRQLLTLSGQAGRTFRVSFSPNGRRVATRGDDQTTRVCDASTGNLVLTLPTQLLPSGKVTSPGTATYGMTFSLDGTRLATAGRDGNMRVWDASTGKVLLTLPGEAGMAYSVAFSPDGTRLATGTAAATQLWDTATGKALLTLPGQAGTTYSVAFSPDGTRLAAGRIDRTVKVWNVVTGQVLFTFSGHRGIIYSVAFSPDGKRLATASSDAMVKVWDVSRGKEPGRESLTLSSYSGAIYKVVFSPDGRRLATACQDGTSRIYALPIEDLLAIAKSRVRRVLTTEECEKFLHTAQCPPAP